MGWNRSQSLVKKCSVETVLVSVQYRGNCASWGMMFIMAPKLILFCFDFNGVFCLRKIRGFEFRCVCTLYSVPYSHREQPLSTSYAGIRQALSKATRARSSQNRRNLKAGIEMETTWKAHSDHEIFHFVPFSRKRAVMHTAASSQMTKSIYTRRGSYFPPRFTAAEGNA